jgi:chromosome segregation ATPase
MADLNREMVDLRIHYDEAVTNAKDSGEKLVVLIERARKDQEEAQKVKSERDELSRASEQFQTELDSIRCEREHALGERNEARQECNIARREKNTTEDRMKVAMCAASRLVEESHQLKPEVESLRATVAYGRQQDLARAQELEGKYLSPSIIGFFFEICFLSPVMIRAKE